MTAHTTEFPAIGNHYDPPSQEIQSLLSRHCAFICQNSTKVSHRPLVTNEPPRFAILPLSHVVLLISTGLTTRETGRPSHTRNVTSLVPQNMESSCIPCDIPWAAKVRSVCLAGRFCLWEIARVSVPRSLRRLSTPCQRRYPACSGEHCPLKVTTRILPGVRQNPEKSQLLRQEKSSSSTNKGRDRVYHFWLRKGESSWRFLRDCCQRRWPWL